MRNLKRVLALAMAMVMILGMMVIGSSAASYSDAAAIDEDYAVAVEVLSGMGVFRGQGNGFAPKATLTRAEAAALIYRVITTDVEDDKIDLYDYASFADTAKGVWSTPYITYAANGGYVKGDGTGNFNPNDTVTGVQVLAIMLRAAGYGQNGEYEGAAWMDNVLTDAHDLGLLEDVNVSSLAVPATREIVAQLIWNAITKAYMVTYTPALGYLPVTITASVGKNEKGIVKTLGDKFDLEKDEDYWDNFNRPGYGWTYNTGDEETYFLYDAVETYTTKVSQCDLSTDLKKDSKNWKVNISLNGADYEEVAINAISMAPVKGTAQGTLTEVYKVGKTIYIVEIETWLAQVDDVDKATYDKAGHEKKPANTDFTVYTDIDETETWSYETEEYAKNAYVLLTYSEKEDEDGNELGIQSIDVVEPVDTAKLASYDSYDAQSELGDTTYDWAAKYFEGNTGVIGKTYNVFEDAYGNLIGLVLPSTSESYTILHSGVKVTNGFKPYYAAKILDMETGELEEVKVVKYEDQEENNLLDWVDDKVTDFPGNIVSYAETNKGYELVNAADVWTDTASIVKGEPRIYDADGTMAVTNNTTVFVVEIEDGEYVLYTGYKNVPTIDDPAWVEVKLGRTGYADLVYVNAIDATYSDSSTLAYIMPESEDVGGGVANGEAYDRFNKVVIDGNVTTVKVAADYADTFDTLGGKAVKLIYDVNGLVVGYKDIKFEGWTVEANASDEVVYFEDQANGYVVGDDTVIWLIDTENNKAEVGEASDLEKGVHAAVTVAKDDKTMDIVIIWAELD